MTNEILEAIQKSLPTRQFKMFMEELEKAKKVPDLEEQLKQRNQRIDDLINDNSKLMLSIKSETDLKIREEALKIGQQNLALELLKKDVECAKLSLAKVENLAMAAFRNPEVHKSYHREVIDPSNTYGTKQLHESSTTTRS